MTQAERIADQMACVFDGDAWYGPSLARILDAFTPQQAAARALPHRHSAWELVLHLAANIDWVCHRLQGRAVELTPSEDWPAVQEVTEREWRAARAALERSHTNLLRLVAGLADSQLMEQVPGRDYPVYVMLHGITQHNAYHAGQLAILRPAPDAPPS
jgi:uncharacterized damage-inducible protein DinB